MSMFPGPGAEVYYNEVGEPLGWDYPDYDQPTEPEEWYEGWDHAQDHDPSSIDYDEYPWDAGDVE